MIKYAYTILYVEDVTKSIEFYEKAFGFSRKFITPENDYGEISSGETTLAFASLELGKSNFSNGFERSSVKAKPFGIEIAFTVDDVEKTMESAIAAGATSLEDTVTKPWGQTVGYVRDLDGFIIEICTVVKG